MKRNEEAERKGEEKEERDRETESVPLSVESCLQEMRIFIGEKNKTAILRNYSHIFFE